jgi:thiol-disulfide isomerase/thioredoxin
VSEAGGARGHRVSEATRRRLRGTAFWVALGLAILGIRAYQTRDAARGAAPDLRGTTLDGRAVELGALRAGGPVMVHFWATWCGICAAERGNVETLAASERVLTVASRSGDAAEVARYARAHGVRAPVLVDPSGAVAQRWGVRAFPTTFFVAPDGEIAQVEVGYTTTVGMRLRLWLAGAGR